MRALIICAVAASLAACQTTAPLTSAPVQQVSNTVVLQGTRGLILAHNAYQSAAAVAAAAIRSRQVSAANVDRIEVLNERAKRVFDGADKAQTVAQRTSELFSIANELLTLGGK